MFDIGFSELFIIMLVGLLVIGPERLPKVARTIGAMLGRLQRYVNDVKADITREVELEELRKMKTEFEEAARSMEQSVADGLRETESELNRAIAPAEAPAAGDAEAASAVAEHGGAATHAVPPDAADAAPGEGGAEPDRAKA
ncbi:MAG: Sec-independent protein translocase protein TatB [Burkholderiales bacterium]|nr:Sec-independent protein translocase protein TatB [Burkholderiales bacterium]